MRRRLWFGLALLVVGCLVLSACGPGPSSAAPRSELPSSPQSSSSTSFVGGGVPDLGGTGVGHRAWVAVDDTATFVVGGC